MDTKKEALGFSIPWALIDSLIISALNSNEDRIEEGTDFLVGLIDDKEEEFVNNTTFKFDNVGKEKVNKAWTKSMVKRYMPELLQ